MRNNNLLPNIIIGRGWFVLQILRGPVNVERKETNCTFIGVTTSSPFGYYIVLPFV
jgi:hypothetical protein